MKDQISQDAGREERAAHPVTFLAFSQRLTVRAAPLPSVHLVHLVHLARRLTVRAGVLLLLLAACAGPASSPDLAWTAMNQGLRPRGQPLAVLFDRSTPGRLLAGLNAGRSLYSSADGGAAWQPITSGLPPVADPWPPPTYSLVQAAASPETILAATGGGLFRSADAGATWQPVEPVPGALPAYALAADRAGALYLGGEGPVVRRSDDDGLTWRALSPLSAGGAVLSLAVSPDGGWLLAGSDGAGLFSSRDSGATWQPVEAVGDNFVSSIVLQPAARPPCGDVAGCALVRARNGLFATVDGGRVWSKVALGQEGRIDAIAVAGERPAWIAATDRGQLYRSTDGEMWALWGEGFGRRGAVFTLTADPERPDVLIAGTENGLYSSADAGLTWRQSMGGPGAPSADALAMDPGGALYLGNADGVYASDDAGATWQPRSRGLPPAPILALAVASSAPNVLYAGASSAGLFRSQDGGLAWSPTSWQGASVPGIVVGTADPDRLYYRVAFERVYSSDDGGASTAARWDGFTPFTEIMSLVVDPRDPQRLYAGGTDAFYRSLDGAASWQPVGPELDGQTVYAMLVDDAGPGRLLAGATKGVYESGDGGLSWRRWGRGLEDITVTALALHPARRDLAFAGTKYRGVYRTGDGGRTWQPAGLGELSVNALFVSPDGRWLHAATPQGFYRGEAR